MIKKIEPIFSYLLKFLHKKNIIVFIGHKGILLTALLNNKIIDELLIDSKDRENIAIYEQFFN